MTRFYILAGNYEQAKTLAERCKLAPNEWAYVDSRERLLGVRDGVMILTGTWRSRKDGIDLLETAYARRMKTLHDEN